MSEKLRWLERDEVLCERLNKVYVGTDLRCNVHYKCSICDQDKELFPDKVFIKPRNRFNETTPLCGCDKGCRYNKYEMNILAKRYCEKSGKKLHHQVGDCSGVRTKFKVSCLNPVCRYEQVKSLDSLSRSFSCIKCRTWKKPTQESTDRFIKKFKESGYYIEGTCFKRNTLKTDSRGCYSFWDVYCPVDGCERWFVSPHITVSQGYKSCNCNLRKGYDNTAEEGVYYVYKWFLPNKKIFLKQGITNGSSEKRTNIQKRKCKLEKEKVIEVKSDALQIERLEKSLQEDFDSLCQQDDYERIPKYLFPDGYTETIVRIDCDDYTEVFDRIQSKVDELGLRQCITFNDGVI